MVEEKWTVVFKAAGIIQAQIVSGRLQADGIPTRLQYETIGAISCSLNIDGLGEVKIAIPELFVDRAREILEQHFDESDLHWKD